MVCRLRPCERTNTRARQIILSRVALHVNICYAHVTGIAYLYADSKKRKRNPLELEAGNADINSHREQKLLRIKIIPFAFYNNALTYLFSNKEQFV